MPPLPPISRKPRLVRGRLSSGDKVYPFGGRREEEEPLSASERMIGRLTLAVMIFMIARSLNLI